MTRIITVSFRNEDEDLWVFIEKNCGKPVNGTKIRDILYMHKNAKDTEGDRS